MQALQHEHIVPCLMTVSMEDIITWSCPICEVGH